MIAAQSNALSEVPPPMTLRAPHNIAARHAKMVKQVAAIEDLIAKLSAAKPGIGHNRPPPLANSEIGDISLDLGRLKALPPVPSQPPVEAKATANKLKLIGLSVLAILGTEAVKGAGKSAYEFLWANFGQALVDLAQFILDWVSAL
jgi:hypothetical protein